MRPGGVGIALVFETDRYVVLIVARWRDILARVPRSAEVIRPYCANPCAVFDGRCVVVIETIGL